MEDRRNNGLADSILTFIKYFETLPSEAKTKSTTKPKEENFYTRSEFMRHYGNLSTADVEPLTSRFGWDEKKLGGFLEKIWQLDKVAVLSILTKSIAIAIDKYSPYDILSKQGSGKFKYKINFGTGCIYAINSDAVLPYDKATALFRTSTVAQQTKDKLDWFFKSTYGSHRKVEDNDSSSKQKD